MLGKNVNIMVTVAEMTIWESGRYWVTTSSGEVDCLQFYITYSLKSRLFSAFCLPWPLQQMQHWWGQILLDQYSMSWGNYTYLLIAQVAYSILLAKAGKLCRWHTLPRRLSQKRQNIGGIRLKEGPHGHLPCIARHNDLRPGLWPASSWCPVCLQGRDPSSAPLGDRRSSLDLWPRSLLATCRCW